MPLGGLGLGFGGGAGGPTDYPVPSDVRLGVTYNFGTQVGTYALAPPVVPSTLGPDPFGETAAQSAAIVDLLAAIADRQKVYLRTEARVVQWVADIDKRPPIEGGNVAAVGLGAIIPKPDAGSGRWGWPVDLEVLVGVWTRDLKTQAGDHTLWLRSHDVRVRRAADALGGKMIFATYNRETGQPNGRCLTTAPCQIVPDRIVVKRVDQHEAGVSVLRFRVPTILPLDPGKLT